jgi:hypothetical protein
MKLRTLTLHMDGSWTASDLATALRSVEDLYNILGLLHSKRFLDHGTRSGLFPLNRIRIRKEFRQIDRYPTLRISRLRYGSPGLADLIGAAPILKEVKEIGFGATDRVLGSKMRSQELEERKFQLEKEKLNHKRELAAGEKAEQRKDELHHLEVLERELAVLEGRERLRHQQMLNSFEEVNLLSSASKLLGANGLTGEEQSQVLKWLGSREKPLFNLLEDQKLLGAGVSEPFDNPDKKQGEDS